jgi:deoxyribonuclease IV
LRLIGLHLRFEHSILETLEQARIRALDVFQCFLIAQQSNKLVAPSADQIKEFRQIRSAHFSHFFVHGSYWINLAQPHNNGFSLLMREWRLARKLEATHFVLHPGAARGLTREEGIDVLARAFNTLLDKEHELELVLENTAHGNMAIGSDLNDFKVLKSKLNKPERLRMCLDTSHAYVYGYDIGNLHLQDEFIQLVDQTVGFSSVVLIHLNDTTEQCGSKIDRHALLGTGTISEHMLHRFISHAAFAHLPLLMELPLCTSEQEEEVLNKVRGWR